jgi:signal transduction histidine kinase
MHLATEAVAPARIAGPQNDPPSGGPQNRVWGERGQPQASGAASALRAKRKILVVDDELGPRESLRFLFKDEYDVFCATSVDEGVQSLRTRPPDVVILDIKMPGKSGIEGLSEFRAVDPHVSVIMLTGFGSLETAQKAIRLGANDYIKKPFDTKEMRDAVMRHVERTRIERIRAETIEELQDLNERMQKEIAERERLVSLGEASAEFVHDLRNPLMVIQGYVHILMDAVAKTRESSQLASGDILPYLQRISQSVRRCQEMSEVWRNLGKTDPARMKPCCVGEIVTEAAAIAAPLAAEITARIEVRPGPADCLVMGSAIELYRAVQNLITNAIQALPREGGIVELFWTIDGEHVEIRVQDNGSGIEPAELERLFQPYVTTKAASGGMGLGLFITKKVIETHGGSIRLANRSDGSGVVATVRLPLQGKALPHGLASPPG